MSQPPPSPSSEKPYQGAQNEKEKERLAKALRENLLRRKTTAATKKP